MKRTRKGFTLVELLIVIAIIGVLAAMMTLSSSDATVAAKAASIANGYKIIGTAFTVYHVVSGDYSTATFFTKYSKDYVGPQVKNLGRYSVVKSGDHYYARYDFTNDSAVLAKFTTYINDMGMSLSKNMSGDTNLTPYLYGMKIY